MVPFPAVATPESPAVATLESPDDAGRRVLAPVRAGVTLRTIVASTS